MQIIVNKKKFLIIGTLAIFIFAGVTPAKASLLDNIINGIKDFFTPNSTPSVTAQIDGQISLAENGDLNKNNQIDAGEIITFTFKITNTTDKAYEMATLRTNVAKGKINFIHNVQGATGIDTKTEYVEIPYVNIPPGQVREIKFDARINYFTDNDTSLSVEPELITSDKQTLLKGLQQLKTVKKTFKDKIPSNVQMR